MQDSIHAAIERARKVHKSITAKHAVGGGVSDEESSGDDVKDAEEPASLPPSSSELNSILAMAKHIRTKTPIATHDRVNNVDAMTARAATRSSDTKPIIPSPTIATPTDGSMSASSQQIRLEYPRRMKVLMEQLRDMRDRELHESLRFVFCRKMSEHLSMKSSSRSSGALMGENSVSGSQSKSHVFAMGMHTSNPS
uniref:Uncharacterized protein n=1 Tax=Globisporangium ultimum (strain ATCC 200006 / CBS 805.95 / DAOM BR144) TaxID=431595 RepID=K3W7R6_GLOUD